MNTSDFAYDLPECLIAQTPVTPRDHSRMMCVDRRTGETTHRHFTDLPDELRPGDLLVVNDSRVLPARLYGTKEGTGGAMEFLLLEPKGGNVWEVLVRPGRKAPPGARFIFGGGLMAAEILSVEQGGNRLARMECEGDFYTMLERIGQMPLPPYITQPLSDSGRYQRAFLIAL